MILRQLLLAADAVDDAVAVAFVVAVAVAVAVRAVLLLSVSQSVSQAGLSAAPRTGAWAPGWLGGSGLRATGFRVQGIVGCPRIPL